jgi:magnesium chelatase subunit D
MIDFGADKKASHDSAASLSFSDVVGQHELKSALLAVAANDDLDGLLVRGQKGTAKSTTVRALADLLPAQTVVADCPYGCPPNAPSVQCADCRDRRDAETSQRPVPLVTLPLGATRERLVGTLSVADALDGDHEFDPGLLARANRGILYVDEVNLLDDHLVDVLLDAAASGVNRVERDGVSVTHPAQFTLVGTMNPEEGDLRPQFRDRFALQATVTACEDVDRRVTIIDRALDRRPADDEAEDSVDRDDGATTAASTQPATPPRERLRRAAGTLPGVDLPESFAREIAELCRDAGVEGHRGDIATARAARTFAALDGRPKVLESDVKRAAELALPHRLQSRPFEDAPDADDLVDEHFDDADAGDGADGTDGEDGGEGDGSEGDEGADDRRGDGDSAGAGGGDGDSADGGEGGGAGDEPAAGGPTDGNSHADDEGESGDGSDSSDRGGPGTGEGGGADGAATEARAPDAAGGADGEGDGRSGADADDDGQSGADEAPDATPATPIVPGEARAEAGESAAPEMPVPEAIEDPGGSDGQRSLVDASADADGPRVRSERARSSSSGIDAAASVRAASARGGSSVASRDLRRSVRRSDGAALVLFVVDASASMRPAMRAAKGTVLELLQDAYEARDEVGFVAFAGEDASVLLPPTDSVTLAARHLKELPSGDRTPLPAGLRTAGDVLERADPAASVVVVVTDGRANVADGSPVGETRAAARRLRALDASVVVVDAGDDEGPTVLDALVDAADASRVPLSALSAERVDASVAGARGE